MKTISSILLSMLLLQGAPDINNPVSLKIKETHLINQILNYGSTSSLSIIDENYNKMVPRWDLAKELEENATALRIIRRSTLR